MTVNSYQDLMVWKNGITIVKEVYKISYKFPKEELSGITGKMLRKLQHSLESKLQ